MPQRNIKNNISGDKVKNLTDKYEAILFIVSEEYTEHPLEKEYMNEHKLQKGMREYQDVHPYFLSYSNVDYIYSISEHRLRKFK